MRSLRFAILAVSGVMAFGTPAVAKEAFASLDDYVRRATAIAICKVSKDNGDGTVTASVSRVLKGQLRESEVIRGETGFCVVSGPISRFMTPGRTYLVFLFEDFRVGRLGGILEVEGKTLRSDYLDGLAGATTDAKNSTVRRIPLEEGVAQIVARVNRVTP